MKTEQLVSAMFDYARLSFEAGLRNLELYQDQGERAMALVLGSDDAIREDTRRAAEDWLLRVRAAQEAYCAAVEDGLELLERELPTVLDEAQPDNAA